MGALILYALVALMVVGALRLMLGAVRPILTLLLKAALASALGAIGISATLSTLGAGDGVAVGLMSLLVLFPVSFVSLAAGRRPRPASVLSVHSPATAHLLESSAPVRQRTLNLAPRPKSWLRPWSLFARESRAERDARENMALAEAWNVASGEADWAASRIAVARASCDRLMQQADATPLEPRESEWAQLIKKRVPELVEACLIELRSATRTEKVDLLEDLVQSLEQIGAEAERRRGSGRATRGQFDVLRRYVASRAETDSPQF